MKEKIKIGIIGGTGLYELEGMDIVEEIYPDTPWGKPSDKITIGKFKGKLLAFLPRHGRGHFLLPSEIPNLANIAALKHLGVEEIVAFSSVGSLREEIAPLDFVLPSQIIDRTKSREFTFFGNGIVVHATFGDPFSKSLATRIEKVAQTIGLKLHTNKTLVCMEGPLFSTRAESKMYRAWGADIINMSVLPEAKLAREAEIAYQMVCMSTDYDSWKEHEEAVTVEVVIANLQQNGVNAKKLLAELIPFLGNGEDLSLQGSIKFSVVTSKEKLNSKKLQDLEYLFGKNFL
jgi:5'-methylthioadenosine phosphorylase